MEAAFPPHTGRGMHAEILMKYLSLFFLAFALFLASDAQARSMQELVQEIKKPITLKASKSSHLDVVFNHSSHKGINCFTCHHKVSDKGRYISCSECHNIKGKSKDPQSLFVAFHAKKSEHSCLSCHREKARTKPARYGKAFYNCRPCHLPPAERMSKAEAPTMAK